MSISILLITSVVFSAGFLPLCFSADQQYEKCLSPLICGSGPAQVFPNNITYPFWGTIKPKYCGQSSFQLSCEGEQNLTLAIGNLTLRVIHAYLENQVIIVADESWLDGSCPQIWNFTGKNHFTLNSGTEKIDLFECPENITSLSTISCQTSNDGQKKYHVFGPSSSHVQNCTKVGEIPMLPSAKNTLHQSNDLNKALGNALEQGFELKYTIENQICQACNSSRGICGSDSESESQEFRCLCEDKPHNSSCNVPG